MSFSKILIVDDEVAICKLVEHRLRKQGHTVFTAGRLREAVALLEKEHFDLALLDFHLPDGDGLDLLKRAMLVTTPPVMVMVSACTSLEVAIQCIRAGAFDYMLKPFSIGELDTVVERAIKHRESLSLSGDAPPPQPGFGRIIGESCAIQQLRTMMQKVAQTDVAVLITGESGTGKSRLAEALHNASARADGPLLKVTCPAAGEEEIATQLFGIGIPEEKSGLMEAANGGTIVLEEISDLPLRIQAKLLKVLQEKSFERAGCNKPIEVDMRLIATTRRDLSQCVFEGSFRQDLLLRLNVFPLQAPALRERISDLPLLVEDWLQRLASRHGLRSCEISEEAIRLLMAYHWPGNVVELETALERAVILAGSGQRIEADAFRYLSSGQGKLLRHTPEKSSFADNSRLTIIESDQPLLTLDELEKNHVLRALEHTHQNRTRAAHLLNISVRTLRNKLHQYREESHPNASVLHDALPLISPAAGEKRSVGNGTVTGRS